MSAEPRRKRGSPGDRKWWRRADRRDVQQFIIACFVVWAVLAQRGEGRSRDQAIIKAGSVVVAQGCNSENLALRTQRRQLVDGLPRLRALYHTGSIDRRLYLEALHSTRRRIGTLHRVDCRARVEHFRRVATTT